MNYRASAWVDDAAPAAGRAPDAHALRRDHVGFPLRMFDALRGTEHVVIVALGPDTSFRGSVSDRAKLDAFLRRTFVGGSL